MPRKQGQRRALCLDESRGSRDECARCGMRYFLTGNEALKLVPRMDEVLQPIEPLECPSGTVVYREGEHAETAFTLRRGLVKAIRYLPDGSERIVRLHTAGDAFGIERLLGLPYEQTVISVNHAELCRIPVSVLRDVSERSPQLYKRLVEHWHEHVRRADTWITLFSTGSVRARLARLINYLAEFEPDAGRGQVELLQGEEMAAILGVTQESVSRVLADFKRKGMLRHAEDDPHEHVLYVYDSEALAAMASEH